MRLFHPFKSLSPVTGSPGVRLFALALFGALAAFSVACGGGSAATSTVGPTQVATSTPTAGPTSTPVSTATATPTVAPTATATPEASPIVISDMKCTQTYPGVYNPEGPNSSLAMTAKMTNTGSTDVPVKVSALGGAIIFVTFSDASGQAVGSPHDTTLDGVTSLEAGHEYDVSISSEQKDPADLATCTFGILAENSTVMELSGEYTATVEKVYLP